jgi:hypothetical protein
VRWAIALLLGCAVPRAGDPCSSIEDTFCAPGDPVTIYACLSSSYEAIDCRDVCMRDNLELVGCGPSATEPYDVCRCETPPPCEGFSPIFDGLLGSACRPPSDPTPMCRGEMMVWCDPVSCRWLGENCPMNFGCNAYCDEAGACAQVCMSDL